MIDALRCPKSGKRSFVAESVALKACERSNIDPEWGTHHGHPARDVYLCECGWWHLTSRRDS